MDSEVELHEAIQELHAVATVPDLYPVLVQQQAVTSLLDLLLHENTDISVAVVDLLQVLSFVLVLLALGFQESDLTMRQIILNWNLFEI